MEALERIERRSTSDRKAIGNKAQIVTMATFGRADVKTIALLTEQAS